MQVILTKVSNFFVSIISLLLDNGSGRAVVEKTKLDNDTSGFSVFINTIIDAVVQFFKNIAEVILRILAQIAYFIAKIALNIMDFMNIVIKELSGQATSYSISGNSNLAESDILFQFLFNEITLKIFRAVFIFSILLLIIFTIIAIVKQEWDNRVNGKLSSIKKVFRKLLISLFTMLIVPFILIVGIVFSNVVLSSVMSAFTGQGGTYSIGAQIFSASTYDANYYRIYAQNGKKIPIVFDYDGGFENVITTPLPTFTTSSTTAQDAEIEEAIASGSFATGQATYNMFSKDKFYTFNSISDGSSYYDLYDGPYLKTKQIEYYAMADFIDYAMQSGGKFYIVNVEDMYDSVMNYVAYYDLPDEKENPKGLEAVNLVLDNIHAYDAQENKDLKTIYHNSYDMAQAYVNGNVIVDHYTFNVYYNSARADAIGTEGLDGDGAITYLSVNGSTDEVTGAKYLFATRYEVEENEYIYVPVTLGDMVNGIKFNSNFLAEAPLGVDKKPLRSETMFLARGIFSVDGYPTAIKNEGIDISFYRHNTKAPSVVDFSQIFNYEDTDGNNSKISGGSIIEFLTGVDVSTLVPDIQVNLNFLQVFSKSNNKLTTLNNGAFTLNYSFAGTGFGMGNIYDVLSVNYILLLFACVTMFMGLFYVIWGLIARIYEITLLWITMPGWIAKFPIEKADNIGGKTAFGSWKEKMIERVLALYAIYISMAIVFLLIPVVFGMDYITTFDIEETNIFGLFTRDTANLVIKTAFVLVLFAFLRFDREDDTGKKVAAFGPRMIEEFIVLSGRDASKGYLHQIGKSTVGEVKGQVKKATGFFTPWGLYKTVKGAALNVARGAVNAVPGKAVADRIMDMGSAVKTNIKESKAGGSNINLAQQKLLSQTDEAEIIKSTNELNKTTHDDAYMAGFKQAKQDYWRNIGDNVSRSRSGDKELNSALSEVAKKGGGHKLKVGNKKVKARKVYRQTKKEYK